MIDITKQYRTRDGREARVFMMDNGDWGYPVIAAYKDKDGRWWPLHLTKNGRTSLYQEGPLDLIEVKPRIKREAWVNVYPNGVDDELCFTKAVADQQALTSRIACVRLTIDCEEGEGL